jgi:hypothetical protein
MEQLMIKPSDLNLNFKKLLLTNAMACAAVCVLSAMVSIAFLFVFGTSGETFETIFTVSLIWAVIWLVMGCFSVVTDLATKGWPHFCVNYLCVNMDDYPHLNPFDLNDKIVLKLQTHCKHSYYKERTHPLEIHIYFLSREDMMITKLMLGGEIKLK